VPNGGRTCNTHAYLRTSDIRHTCAQRMRFKRRDACALHAQQIYRRVCVAHPQQICGAYASRLLWRALLDARQEGRANICCVCGEFAASLRECGISVAYAAYREYLLRMRAHRGAREHLLRVRRICCVCGVSVASRGRANICCVYGHICCVATRGSSR
jgi:hypothetical protein